MKLLHCLALAAITATPALAQGTRQLDSHEHGVGQLDIAIEGSQISLRLKAPGADLVGFEHATMSEKERATVLEAVAMLERPLQLFSVPDAAGCSVDQSSVERVVHGETHAEDGDHADHDDHDDHDDHADEGTHVDFQAQYLLTCTDLSAVTDITFGYFDSFANAKELEVQLISDTGAKAFEVKRDDPKIDLDGAL